EGKTTDLSDDGKGGIFTPRVTGTIPGPSNGNDSDSGSSVLFHFPGTVDTFERRAALLITKIGFSARTCIIVTAIARICSAYQGSGSIQRKRK
ncbi:hypothetical protein CEXT_309951, partial [Caerostris extrusa]